MTAEVVDITEVEELLIRSATRRGVEADNARLLASDLLEAELEGKRTHGIGKIFLLDEQLSNRIGAPFVIQRAGAVVRVDGNREIGQIAAAFAAQQAIEVAFELGISAVSLVNSSRYGRVSFVGSLLARAGLVGIVMNDAGPAAVVPHEGVDPLLGTNPICFAFPGARPLVIDMATSEQPWGAIRQAVLSGTDLPEGAFLDREGLPTTDPAKADAVLPFGGAKGYALCVALELLCGGMLTGVVGRKVSTEYELGALILAIDPNRFGSSRQMDEAVTDLRTQITSSRLSPAPPGDRSKERAADARRLGRTSVDSSVMADLRSFASGDGPSIEINDKTN